jgi:FO synthase subunit 1
VPPNLARTARLLDCGVDDLGGVSPVTDDYVNPDYAWPALRDLRDLADAAGVPLHERLPVYDRFLPASLRREGFEGRPAAADRRWLPAAVRDAIRAEDVHGARYRGVIRREPVVPVSPSSP